MISSAGSVDRLQLVAFDASSDPPLEVGFIRVDVRAVGLNFADIFAMQGLYSATPEGAFTPGLEFSGVVSEVQGRGGGEGWEPKVGDKVMGVTRFGGYTTSLAVDRVVCRPLPPGWTFEEGAAFLCTGLTAWHGLVSLGNLSKGHTVLVHSAAGGVGLAALDIIEAFEGVSIATIGDPSKAELLQTREKLPADRIIVRDPSPPAFSAQLDAAMQAAGATEGIDIVMDSVQGPYFEPCFEKLARGGRHIVFGAAAMTPQGARPNWIRLAWQWIRRPMVDPLNIIAENRSVMGFNLIWMWDKKEMMSALLESMMHKVKWRAPVVGKTFPFENAPEAVRFLQSGKSVGKVVLTVGE